MKDKLKKERYVVLAHTFSTINEARDYVQQLADRGECKVLPEIRKWNGRVKGAYWTPTLDKNGEVCLR